MSQSAAAFAAFCEAVFVEAALFRELRVPLERDAYIARVVAIGATRGFAFDEAVVRDALRGGELTWMSLGADVA